LETLPPVFIRRENSLGTHFQRTRGDRGENLSMSHHVGDPPYLGTSLLPEMGGIGKDGLFFYSNLVKLVGAMEGHPPVFNTVKKINFSYEKNIGFRKLKKKRYSTVDFCHKGKTEGARNLRRKTRSD